MSAISPGTCGERLQAIEARLGLDGRHGEADRDLDILSES